MNKVWLQIFGAMIGGSILKGLVPNPLAWVCIDLAILGIVYLILRRHSNVDLKSSMYFLSGLTVISILTDLQMIDDMVSGICIFALVAWMFYGRRRNGNSKPPSINHKWNK